MLLLLLTPTLGAQVECKDVTAPPEDILSGRLAIPDPASCAHWSCTALLTPDELTDAHTTLALGDGKAGVVLLGADARAWTLRAAHDGVGEAVVETSGAEGITPGHLAQGVRFDANATHGAFQIDADGAGDRVVVLIGDGAEDVVLKTWCASHARLVGTPVELMIGVEHAAILDGRVVLTSPSGVVSETALMRDHASKRFVPDEAGVWAARTVVRVRDDAGVVRFRSVQQAIRVHERLVEFVGDPRIEPSAGGRWAFAIEADTANHDERVLLCAELWGTDKQGADVPVCWIARVQVPEEGSDRATLEVTFDPAWLTLAGVSPETLEARHVRAQAMDGTTIIEHRDTMPVTLDDRLVYDARPVDRVTASMLTAHTGKFVPTTSARGARSFAGHSLLISHGYCSGGTPFTVGHYSGDVEVFEDFDQNRSNDEFALLIAQQGLGFKSMGIVAHSQGGAAAAHLYTFYFSSLDWPTGNRRIQSVGTPYQGTALAGNAAVLGEIFGAGCGANTDLAYDGAALWLSTIPTSTRQEISYYTTAFEDGFGFDFCEFATDLFLEDPDDGVTEHVRGQLPGANNMGFVEGQCHTDGMRDPPQCRDASRNAVLNTEAAR